MNAAAAAAKRVLKKARALIAMGWTRGAFARSRTRREVPLESPEAVCFCSVGAIGRASRRLSERQAAREALRAHLPGGYGLVSFNDNPKRKKSEVLALFDKAIESCGG